MPIYKGNAKGIEDIDLPRVGNTISVGEDVIHALLEVETNGSGFDDEGRVKMLFEPHKFYRHLGPGPNRDKAIKQGLAYKTWGQQKYPKDSYPRLEKAIAIDEDAALMSASWGLGQIMGENYNQVGYDTVENMVSAFADDEDNQLEAIIEFLKHNNIDDDLRRIEQKQGRGQTVTAQDWVPVVRVYNGTGYAKNDYHNRANRAYHNWLRIKDTPYGQQANMKEVSAAESQSFEREPVPADREEDVSTPAPPKPENPAPQDITLTPTTPEDKTSKKTFWTMTAAAGTAAATWLTTNIAEAWGYLKNVNVNELMKWLLIIVGIIVALYIIKQILGMVITNVGAIFYNLKSMQYHADPSTNNVKLASPAPRVQE